MKYQIAFNSVTKVALLLAEDAEIPQGSAFVDVIEYDGDIEGFETDPVHDLHLAVQAKLFVITRIMGQRSPEEVTIQYAAD